MEEVAAVEALAAQLGVEVEPAGAEPASTQDLVHRERQLLHRVRELVGVPAVLVIAAVRIHAAQYTGIGSYLQFMLESMTGKSCVVYFNIYLEIIQQVVLP